ncbi:MAG: hypothetical protein ACFB5Z_01590 [Elainellaceae cyanobacterium]
MIYQSKRWLKKAGSLSGAIALTAAMVIASGCSGENSEIQEDRNNVTSEDLSGEISAEGVSGIDSPEGLIGKSVTIRNTIEETIGEESFSLGNDGGESILVINTTGEQLLLPSEDIPVQVTGEVAQLVIADVNSEYGLELDETIYAEYEDRPAIIANSLALAPKIEQLVEYADAFNGQLIAVKGDVRNATSPDTMTLFEQGWVDDIGILVVGVESGLKSSEPLQDGETYLVTGRPQSFDADSLSQEYDLGLEPDQLDEFAQRYNRPVIVADDVYSSAVD